MLCVLWELEKEEIIELPSFPRDQLYRVVEKALVDATGVESFEKDHAKVEEFMNGLFDLQESCSGDIYQEVDRASERIRSFIDNERQYEAGVAK